MDTEIYLYCTHCRTYAEYTDSSSIKTGDIYRCPYCHKSNILDVSNANLESENKTQAVVDETSGTKFDNDKARLDLIPPVVLEELGKLYAKGAIKYQANNWMKGMAWGRVYAALLRHALLFWKGEKYDKEDGQSHLISCIWNCITLYEYERLNLGTDDRVFKGE